MSDDVFEAFGDDDIFAEEEEPLQQTEGQNQNRLFIAAVAVLGGLLVCSLIAFGVWALVLNRPQEAAPPPTEVVASPTTEVVVVEDPATPEPPTETPAPTETPEPTPTPLLAPTATPNGEEVEGDPDTATAVEVTEGEAETEATQVVRRTPTPMPTPQTTTTPTTAGAGTNLGASSGQLSQTGLTEWLLIGVALFLVAVMVAARRLRQA